MTKSPDLFAKVRRSLLLAYGRGEKINISDWTSKYPQIRNDLLEYWVLLRATPRVEMMTAPVSVADHGVAQEAFRKALEALSLGPGWLEDPYDPEETEQRVLGIRLEEVRRSHFEYSGKASIQFRRAAVYAWVAVSLAEQRSSVSRLATQKVTHLLERSLTLGLFEQHREMPLGPYDSVARYKDAEPIAAKQEWLTILGTQLVAGDKSAVAARYAKNYLRAPNAARALVRLLSKLSDAQLETWATVQWIASELAFEKKPYDPTSIRKRLREMPKWAAKLQKRNFAESEIATAVESLLRLRIVDSLAHSE